MSYGFKNSLGQYTKIAGKGESGDKIQYDTLPTNPTFGQIIQWVGTTTTDLINGRFYRYEANSVTWVELFNNYFDTTSLDIKEGMSFIYNGHSIVKIEYAIEDDGATCVLYDSNDTEIAYITKSDPADFSILELDPVYTPSGSWIEVDMGGGTTDYTELENKPSINNVELSGNKSADDLGLYTKTEVNEKLNVINKTINDNWQNSNNTNMIKYPYTNGMSKTVNGITFVVNSNGTVTVNGIASSDATFELNNFIFEHFRKYKITGCPSGGGYTKYNILVTSGDVDFIDNGDGVITTYASETDTFTASIVIKSGTTVSDIVFKPMVVNYENESEIPTEYKRYAMSNTELTDKINSMVLPVNPTITPTTEGAIWIEIV